MEAVLNFIAAFLGGALGGAITIRVSANRLGARDFGDDNTLISGDGNQIGDNTISNELDAERPARLALVWGANRRSDRAPVLKNTGDRPALDVTIHELAALHPTWLNHHAEYPMDVGNLSAGGERVFAAMGHTSYQVKVSWSDSVHGEHNETLDL